MSDLVEFLKARLDEDERAAIDGRADPADPTSGEWIACGHPPGPYDRNKQAQVELVGAMSSTCENDWAICDVGQHDHAVSIAAHIARHDPARVLRDIAARRRTIERYEISLDAPAPLDEHVRGMDEGYRMARLAQIREAAAVWSDHKDYRAEWAA